MAGNGHNPVSGATAPGYLDQTVEIALGPKAAFEGGNVGAVTRRVVAIDPVANASSRTRRVAKLPGQARVPRVVELLRKAQEWRRQIDAGEVRNQADIARRERVTRARVTQVMGLLRLAPEIQQRILSMPDAPCRPAITERALRSVIQAQQHADQRAELEHLLGPAEHAP